MRRDGEETDEALPRNCSMAGGDCVLARRAAGSWQMVAILFLPHRHITEQVGMTDMDKDPMSKEAETMHTPTLYACCKICSSESEDSPCHTLNNLRLTPDNDWYCEACWDDSPYNEDGEWEKAETLDHRINSRRADLVEALKPISGARLKSIDKDNMEFQITLTCYEVDAIRAALKKAGA